MFINIWQLHTNNLVLIDALKLHKLLADYEYWPLKSVKDHLGDWDAAGK